jgi:RNA polymerase sigma-70 factor (ECF subfamily)
MNSRPTHGCLEAPRQLDLAALLERAASGDRDAFAQFYDATATAAQGLALRVVGNRALAEEVTQEAYLALWRAAGRFNRNRGTAFSFLITIVHRRAVDSVRASRAANGRDQSYHRQQPTVDPDPTAAAAHARLGATKVRAALAGLTSVQRQALELAYFGGLTHHEVAATLGIPLGTAKTRIREALIGLRRRLDDDGVRIGWHPGPPVGGSR